MEIVAIAMVFGSIILFFGGATLFQRSPEARQVIVRTTTIIAIIAMIGRCRFLLYPVTATQG